MKTASAAMQAHLQQTLTTLCTCWQLTREDGVALFFTDLDIPISYGGNTYQPDSGYTRSAIQSSADLAVDNMDVEGLVSSDAITEQDLRNGVYDYAQISIFMLNWADISMGRIALRTGYFGEVIATPTGGFRTELRGLTQLLSNNFGQVCQPVCRADLGDSRCTVPVDPPVWQPSTAYALGTWVKAVVSSTAGADPYGGVIFQVIGAGTSGQAQPVFDTAVDGTTSGDGTVGWKAFNSYTKQGTVLGVQDRRTVLVTGLVNPNGVGVGPSAQGLTQPINDAMIPTTGWTLDSSGAVTLTVTSTKGNALFANIDVEGAGANNTVTGDGTDTLLIYGQPTQVNAILTTMTYNNATSLVDVVELTCEGKSVQTISLPQVEQYFNPGVVKFVSGLNTGKVVEIENFANSVIGFRVSLPFMPVVGDQFRIYPGCTKTRANCLVFDNVINFRGEPDLPGQDFLTSAGTLTVS